MSARGAGHLGDVTLLTSAPCDRQELVAACTVVDARLKVRERGRLFDVGYFEDPLAPRGVRLRIEAGRLVGNDAELGRLVPGAARHRGPVWWADAQADVVGVSVVEALAAALDGTSFVQDGSFINREEDPASWMGRFARVRGVGFRPGRSEFLIHDRYMGFTYGHMRFEELHDIRRTVTEHDPGVFSDPASLLKSF